MRTCTLRVSSFVLMLAGALPASADDPNPIDRSIHPVTLAVIGDSPYGSAQVADFPKLVTAVNADSDVSRVVHVGDIKNGSTRCDQSYFEVIAGYCDTFEDSLVYTPGDNEWTDCHRSNNGKYKHFSQASVPGYEAQPENQAWVQARTVFATLQVAGSRRVGKTSTLFVRAAPNPAQRTGRSARLHPVEQPCRNDEHAGRNGFGRLRPPAFAWFGEQRASVWRRRARCVQGSSAFGLG